MEKSNFPRIEWFGDYHDIETKEKIAKEYDPLIRFEEISPDDFGYRYVGGKRFRQYPALVYHKGEKPTKHIVGKLFAKIAACNGFEKSL